VISFYIPQRPESAPHTRADVLGQPMLAFSFSCNFLSFFFLAVFCVSEQFLKRVLKFEQILKSEEIQNLFNFLNLNKFQKSDHFLKSCKRKN
jgi:hypothetical protein